MLVKADFFVATCIYMNCFTIDTVDPDAKQFSVARNECKSVLSVSLFNST